MAGLFEWLFGARADATPVPELPGPAPLARFETYREDSVHNPLTGLGDPSRDKGAAGRPSRLVIPLDDEELRSAYRFNGIARRIVDVRPDEATRCGWTCNDVPASEDERLRTWERVGEAMSMAGAYGGSVLLLATEDAIPRSARGNPREWLMQPLDLERVGALRAIHVFDAWGAMPGSWNEDPLDPAFGEPASWHLSRGQWYAHVHASRVLWFRGNRRPPSELQGGFGRANRMPDDSVLQVVWDEIGRWCSTMAGGAVLAQELREAVIKVHGYSAKATGDDANAFRRMLSLMARTKSLLGLIVLGENDSYENRSNAPAGFGELSESQLTALCAVLGWPRVMLTGQPPGGLSTNDQGGLERQRKIVSAYQERHRSLLERLYRVVLAAKDGPTRGRIPEELGLAFAPLDEPTAEETAKVRKTTAETDAINISSGVYTPADVARSRYSEEGWSLEMQPVEPPDPDDEAAIERARKLLEAAGGDPAGAGGDPDDEPGGEPRADAAGPRSCVIWVPASDPGLRAAVEAAIGQPLNVESEPHITVLYLGDMPELDEAGQEGAEADIAQATADVAAEMYPITLEQGAARAFPHGSDGTPIAIEFGNAWPLEHANGQLLRALAHRVTARQHPRYRAHLTLGYASSPLTPEQLSALSGVDASGVRVPVTALVARLGRRVLTTELVGGG